MGLDELAGKIIIIFFVFPIILLIMYMIFLEVSDKVKDTHKENVKRSFQENFGEYPDIKKKWRESSQYNEIFALVKQRVKDIIVTEKKKIRYVDNLDSDKEKTMPIVIEVCGNGLLMTKYLNFDTESLYSFGHEYSKLTIEQSNALLRVISEDIKKEFSGLEIHFFQDIHVNSIVGMKINISEYLLYKEKKDVFD